MNSSLDITTVPSNPLVLIQQWLNDAASLPLSNAMALATSTHEGIPSVRMVLLKQVDENGFVFYTNYNSRKGKELSQNPSASLLFWWGSLERQVRIEGNVEKVSAQESDEYFSTRPRDSQISAAISPQSEIVTSREVLETDAADLRARYTDQLVPRPSHWGGYRVKPEVIEFWQGREGRLHDRIQYVLQRSGTWKRERLAP
jgi:pyridoxamine 5'-phosphate oxidase